MSHLNQDTTEIIRLRAEVEQLRSIKLNQVWKHDTKTGETTLMKCQHCSDKERERDEALAQVAKVNDLLMEIREAFGGCPRGETMVERARALLDRLQRAEAVGEAAKVLAKTQTWDTPLRKALAAWEEGKR